MIRKSNNTHQLMFDRSTPNLIEFGLLNRIVSKTKLCAIESKNRTFRNTGNIMPRRDQIHLYNGIPCYPQRDDISVADKNGQLVETFLKRN